MQELLPTDLTLRRFLGYFLPGFAWLALILLAGTLPRVPSVLGMAAWLHDNPLAYGAALSLAAFVLGAVTSSLGLRLAAAVGDLIDWVTAGISRWRVPRAVVKFIANRLHILHEITIPNREKQLVAELAKVVPVLPALPNEHASWRGRSYKLYVLEHARDLGREALDLEADINLYAGLWLPSLGLGLWARGQHLPGIGLALIVLSVYLALRVQYLRHKEVETIAASYMILRATPEPQP